mgnify:CR=1 FL=1
MKNFTSYYVSLFLVGYIKFAPGSVASLISVFFLYFILEILKINFIFFVLFYFITFLLSLYLITLFSKENKVHDSSIIVIDEFLGIYLIFLFYDYFFFYDSFITLLSIFILFRFFDILKIYPANIIDKKIINSLGVILDDTIAAIYTIIILYLINVFI